MPHFPPNTPKLVAARLRAAGCVFAEDEAALLIGEASDLRTLEAMVARRANGEPIEQVVGWAEFCGLHIIIEPGVFVPRRRSEFMAHRAVALTKPGDVVVDLGCGSGALGAAVAARVAKIELYGADIDPTAVHCARRNIDGQVFEGDLFGALPTDLHGRINTLVANMPYVPTEAMKFMPAEARLHEPRVTLDGGSDGLDLQRRVAAGAVEWLAPGGHVLFEASATQASESAAILSAVGFSVRVSRSKKYEATVVIGSAPQPTN